MSTVYYDNINGFSQLKMENGKLYGRLNSGEWQEIETGGEQGEPGAPGADGVSAYVYWAWCADPATRAGFSLTDPADYISFITRNNVLVSPQFSDFSTWVKYVGSDGTDGDDGLSTYVYYAYASDASGTNFALSPADGLNYQAILVTHTELVSPSLADFAGLFYQYKCLQTVGHNIFDIFYSMSSTTPPGAMDLSLGTLISNCNTVFPDFWEACVARKADGSIRTLTEDEWQAEVTANGSCGAFVVDEEAKSVRLPKITNMIQPGDVGVFAEAGLPNITGDPQTSVMTGAYGSQDVNGMTWGVGALTATGGTKYWDKNTSGTNSYAYLRFDASKSNTIYGKSTTVQPPAVGAKLYIQVFTSAVPASMAQAGEFINMLESYLPLSGGTMAGGITSTVEDIVTRGDTTGRLAIHGGTAYHYGASVYLFGKDHATAPGIFAIYANDGTEYNSLIGYPDGRLTWGNVPVLNPTGTVIAFAGNSAPAGYLICNGAAVSRTTYAKLFAIIGTTYGTGNGSTTFNLPNLTDKFIMGSGTAGTSKAAGLPNITGTYCVRSNMGAITSSGTTSGAFYKGTQLSTSNHIGSTSGNSSYYLGLSAKNSNAIYGKSTTVQPPALTMRFYIKY